MNHHIYGSSRVGLHNYWPQQYYSSWNFKEGMFDTSLNKRRPWYSLPSNELVNTNYSDPWGHGLARSITAEHILGLRQYELTNQTQNVMAVVLDKRFIKTTGNGNRDRFMASISAAYDYYPYGMLMPGRTTADTMTHCMTVMKEFKSAAPFPKAADMSKAVATLGGTFTPPGGGGLMGGTVVYGKSGGLKLDLTVVPGDAIDVRTDVSWLTGFGVTVTVSETTVSGVKRTLGSKTVSFPGLVTLPVRPSVNKITLTVDNMSSFVTVSPTGIFSIAGVSYDSLAYWSQWSPVTICDKNVDKYPFGFNGQMKSNDVAGIGNFNTAEFWEYSTRTGRRLNLDPKPNVSMSRYSTFSGNPILLSDINGDTTKVFSSNGNYLGTINDNLDNQIHFIKTRHEDQAYSRSIKRANASGKAAANDLASYYRANSIMSIKRTSISNLRKFAEQASKMGEKPQPRGMELGFVATPSAERRTLEFSLLPNPISSDGNWSRTSFPMDAVVKRYFNNNLPKLFVTGHTHVHDWNYADQGNVPFKRQLKQIAVNELAHPSGTGNEGCPDHQCDVLQATDDKPSFIITPYGITIYNRHTGADFNVTDYDFFNH